MAIANNPEASLELRGRMNAELAQYVYPKRRAMDLAASDGDGGPIEVTLKVVKPYRE